MAALTVTTSADSIHFDVDLYDAAFLRVAALECDRGGVIAEGSTPVNFLEQDRITRSGTVRLCARPKSRYLLVVAVSDGKPVEMSTGPLSRGREVGDGDLRPLEAHACCVAIRWRVGSDSERLPIWDTSSKSCPGRRRPEAIYHLPDIYWERVDDLLPPPGVVDRSCSLASIDGEQFHRLMSLHAERMQKRSLHDVLAEIYNSLVVERRGQIVMNLPPGVRLQEIVDSLPAGYRCEFVEEKEGKSKSSFKIALQMAQIAIKWAV